MFELKKKEFEKIAEIVETIIAEKGEDIEISDLMAEIYIKGLPDKTPEQATIITQSIIEIVANHKAEFDKAMENNTEWIEAKLNSLTENKSVDEKCASYLKVLKGIATLNSLSLNDFLTESDIDIEAFLSEIDGEMMINPDMITPEFEQELREKAFEAVQHCGFLYGYVEDIADSVKNLQEDLDITEMIVGIGKDLSNYKSLMAMIAYISAKNGAIDVPPNVGLEEITIGVCTAVEAQKYYHLYKAGKILEDVLHFVLNILGAVCMFSLTAILGALSVITISALINPVIGILAGTFITFVIGTFLISSIDKLADFTTDVIVTLVSSVTDILKNTVVFAKDKVFPSIAEFIKNTGAYIKGLFVKEVIIIKPEEEIFVENHV
jgi:hypothetical protein